LGQFFTVNSDYILQNLEKYVKNKVVTDPFAGSGDLLRWAKKCDAKSIKGHEIDKKYIDNKNVYKNDSILKPLKYKFVLTNPPYLNINKAKQQVKETYFSKFKFEDLYQISLFSIMDSDEGIAIVPINFLSAENSKEIRKIFFSKFTILEMNYFRHQVFSDTTYNVIAFYYKKNGKDDKFSIKTRIYPEDKTVNITLEQKFDWTIAGDFLKVIKNQKNILGIRRLTVKDIPEIRKGVNIPVAYNHVKNVTRIQVSKDLYDDVIKNNIILLKAIDSGTENGKIALENIKKYGVECLISKPTSRHMIYLVFDKRISISDQEKIVELFNKEIEKMRNDYFSLFLTNYRDNDRKRISFDFVYKFLNYLYFNHINNQRTANLFS